MSTSKTESTQLLKELQEALSTDTSGQGSKASRWSVKRDARQQIVLERSADSSSKKSTNKRLYLYDEPPENQVAKVERNEGAGASLLGMLSKFGLSSYVDDIVLELERSFRESQAGTFEPVAETMVDYLVRSVESVPPVYEGWEVAGPKERRKILAEASRHSQKDRAESAAGQTMSLFSSTLSQTEAAELLGVNKSNVSRQGQAEKLYVVDFGRSKRYPKWQFSANSALPQLQPVVHALNDAGFDALSVERFMNTSRDELEGLSPREHLLSGGTPNTVLALIEGWIYR